MARPPRTVPGTPRTGRPDRARRAMARPPRTVPGVPWPGHRGADVPLWKLLPRMSWKDELD
ncbi:MAG TPA: hypothetical protein VN597_04445 [Streptosporangiaceae bacterium]|nr:hypothetical protein [Streptosporangiaceae bacterium]